MSIHSIQCECHQSPLPRTRFWTEGASPYWWWTGQERLSNLPSLTKLHEEAAHSKKPSTGHCIQPGQEQHPSRIPLERRRSACYYSRHPAVMVTIRPKHSITTYPRPLLHSAQRSCGVCAPGSNEEDTEQASSSNGGKRSSLNSGFPPRRGWPIRSLEN
jgi:hypothetical protein